MSRIGKNPITIPAGVEVKVEGHTVTVKGPKGTLTQEFLPYVNIAVEGTEINVTIGIRKNTRSKWCRIQSTKTR